MSRFGLRYGRPMDNDELQEHIASTYNRLRFGMFALAALAPFLVVVWGWLWAVEWQNSISAYYFAPAGDLRDKYYEYPVRVIFTGIMSAIGSFLFLYKGFSRREDIALNAAGIFAIGVAICPMYAIPSYIPISNVFHFTFAILLFGCMAFTAIFCHEETLRWIDDPKLRTRYRVAYHIIGWFMGLFPLTGLAIAGTLHLLQTHELAFQRHVFWIEAAGIWAFAAYWLVKSLELKHSQAEARAIRGIFPPHPPR